MDGAEGEEGCFAGFDEFDGEAEGEVAGEVETEASAGGWRMSGGARGEGRGEVDGESEEDNKEAFVELCGMASEAVAEIDGPWKRRDGAIGAVSEAREKTADATERGADGERPDERVAGGTREAEARLGDFDTGPAAEESAHDGFAAEERPGIGVEERGVVVGRLGPREEFGTGPRAENAADQEPEILVER